MNSLDLVARHHDVRRLQSKASSGHMFLTYFILVLR